MNSLKNWKMQGESKKCKYSRYNGALLMAAKHNKISIDDCRRNYVINFKRETKEDVWAFNRLETEYWLHKGHYINLFIKDLILLDLFKNTEVRSKFHIPDLFKNSPIDIREECVLDKDSNVVDSNSKAIHGVIHTKDVNFGSILFRISIIDSNKVYFKIYTKNYEHGLPMFSVEDIIEDEIIANEKRKFFKDGTPIVHSDENYDYDSNNRDLVRLVFNLLLYMSAFPDKIVNGTPSDFKRTHLHPVSKHEYSVGTSEKMLDKSSPIPHIRSGHFRKLESDYYKKKKGQVVWIESTMVKGKAKTVLN